MKNDEAIVWKAVNGLDGNYEISNLGSVRRVRVDRKGKVSYKYITKVEGRIDFYKNGERVRRSTINQLMYEHFGIPTLEGEVWMNTEDEDIKISSLKRVYNIRTGHFLEGENVKVTKMYVNAFGLPSDEDEQWSDIEGYNGIYQVSDKGRVRNVKTGKILKQQQKKGYMIIFLRKDGKVKFHQVHRLVAKAFVFNPNEKEFNVCNHRDENPLNNRADNLEWCNQSYNINYGSRNERAGKSVSETCAKKRQERLDNCKTEAQREQVLKELRIAESKRNWYWGQKNQ